MSVCVRECVCECVCARGVRVRVRVCVYGIYTHSPSAVTNIRIPEVVADLVTCDPLDTVWWPSEGPARSPFSSTSRRYT